MPDETDAIRAELVQLYRKLDIARADVAAYEQRIAKLRATLTPAASNGDPGQVVSPEPFDTSAM